MYIVRLSLFVISISNFALVAHADIYMQENTENEIYLTNLLSTTDATSVSSQVHTYGAMNTRYILLTEDTKISNDSISSVDGDSPALIKHPLLLAEAVATAAQQTKLDPALLHAVIRVESAYNPRALSPRGALGLMQLMPATAKRFDVKNPYDPHQNILAGAKYLSELSRMFKGDIRLALAAYNAGPNAVIKYGSKIPPYTETKLYVPKVLNLYHQLSYKQHFPGNAISKTD